MKVSFQNRPEVFMHIEPLDSAGRNPELIAAMETNDPKPVRVKGADKAAMDWLATEYSTYPKAMFRLALRNGKAAGDPITTDPIPADMAEYLAEQFGMEGTRLGNSFIPRHPYVSKLVGVVRADKSIDVPASQEQERQLYREGWRDSPSKLIGLPKKATLDESFDPLPAEMLNQEMGKTAAPKPKAS